VGSNVTSECVTFEPGAGAEYQPLIASAVAAVSARVLPMIPLLPWCCCLLLGAFLTAILHPALLLALIRVRSRPERAQEACSGPQVAEMVSCSLTALQVLFHRSACALICAFRAGAR
jgi:uncharacterized membrane protein